MANIFSLCGDLLHLLSFIILFYQIFTKKNCQGVSLKTQELLLIVFLTRYSDLLTNWISLYIFFMKVLFLVASSGIVFLMRTSLRKTYDKENDSFRNEFLIIPCAILALIVPEEYTITEILWTFSVFLESVAILPQLFLIQAVRKADAVTSHYIFVLGSYRVLYLVNWVYRYFFEGYVCYNAWIAGIIQTILYSDFFYLYISRIYLAAKFQLPISDVISQP